MRLNKFLHFELRVLTLCARSRVLPWLVHTQSSSKKKKIACDRLMLLGPSLGFRFKEILIFTGSAEVRVETVLHEQILKC